MEDRLKVLKLPLKDTTDTGPGGPLISLEMYLMGRDKLWPDEYTPLVRNNAILLLDQVNGLLEDLVLKNFRYKVTSGWRPLSVNRLAKGAKRSLHLVGRAIDIADTGKKLSDAILDRTELLSKWHLWLESPRHTNGWVHLDNGDRSKREPRIFAP